jgi:CBS domain-containing protein
MLAQNALSVSPPLGRIRDFVTGADPEHPGTIDLKKVRRAPVHRRRTGFCAGASGRGDQHRRRLKRAGALMNISSDDLAASLEGFNFIQLLRLRHQHFEQEHGRPETI